MIPIIPDNPTLILGADFHFRSTTPSCRTDDFLKTQMNKALFISSLIKKYKCPVLVAGDFGNSSEWKNWLISFIMILIDEIESKDYCFYIVPGQHDLPNHELKRWKWSGIGTLSTAGYVSVLTKNAKRGSIRINVCPYGKKIPRAKIEDNVVNILVAHKMVIKDKELWPGQTARTASYMLRRYPEYDLILTGDNHQSFTKRYQGRVIVNPGSLMRTTIEQKHHKPRIYLWYAETNSIVPIFIPIEKNVMNTRIVVKEKAEKKRMKTYVKKMKTGYEIGLSFEKNMEKHLEKNKPKKRVKKQIWKFIDKGKNKNG